MASNEEWTIAQHKKKKVREKPIPPAPIPYATRSTTLQNRIPHPMAKPNKPANTDITSEYNFRPRNRSPLRDRERNTEFPQRWGSKGDTAVTPVGLSNKLKNKSPPNKEKNEFGFTKRPGVLVPPQLPKKAKKIKKKKTNPNAHYLRSVNEVSLNLSDVLKEVPKTKDKTKISTGVTVRPQPQTKVKNTITPRNVLDSTAPLVRRGKERATPKIKKPTKLKRLVLEERRLIKLQKNLRKVPNSEDSSKEKLLLIEQNKPCIFPEIRITFVDSELNEHEAPSLEYANAKELNTMDEVEDKPDSVAEKDTHEISDNTTEKEDIDPTAKVEIETFEVNFIGEGLPGLHTRKFREYCYQMPDKEVDELTNQLLYELMKLQARQHDMNKMKSKGRKRLVFGFHEVTKHLRVHNLKCVVIARDLERSRAIGGLEHQITTICSRCKADDVQVVFALTKHTLSFSVCKPKTIVSIVGILNYDGRQGIYKDLKILVEVKEREYFETVREKRTKLLQAEDQEVSRVENETETEKKNQKPVKTKTTIQIKKFDQEDTKIAEFVPTYYQTDVEMYQSHYIQPYGYYPVYTQYYYSAYQYDQ
eukprot:TRINITY_DN7686_c0_g1_i1.p1 TRINITY_DN7686_c0_g1~~TRINITY_DN7686_c0_g1_i1.p1  ORF type:complete len:589 (+),score=111.28 TRINITY_DN7686_c0_g1_i1:40-1806(+)